MNRKNEGIKKRIREDKEKVLENLRKTPIIQLAVKNAGVGRTTYYRWSKEDKKFAQAAQDAMREGYLFVNDIAESQTISAIKDREMSAIRFWLQHNHPRYANKLEIKGSIQHEHKELTKAQKELIRKALRLAGLDDKRNKKHGEK